LDLIHKMVPRCALTQSSVTNSCAYSMLTRKHALFVHLTLRPVQSACKQVKIRGCIQKFPDGVDKELYTLTKVNKATQRAMAVKLTILTHKIAIQLHLVAESCTICSSRARQPVRKLVDTLIFTALTAWLFMEMLISESAGCHKM
jgi:hypothetical protein